MKEPDPLEEARKRVTPFLEKEEWLQGVLPGMEDCEFGCLPVDHGDFEYGDDDD
jgi:hypothetical protein